jgi:hypothetical protein
VFCYVPTNCVIFCCVIQIVTLYQLTASCVLIRSVQVNQDELKLNGIHQLWVYADDVNMLGDSTVVKNTEALIVVRKENGLAVNADRAT